MEIAIIGLPQSGKSTLFKIMTGTKSADVFGETCVEGIAKIPDERFNALVGIFKPVKATPASIPFIDIKAEGEKAWNTVRQRISGTDGLIHIVDAFTNEDVSEVHARYKKIEDELIFADLIVVENRLERLNKISVPKPEEKSHKEILPKLKEGLEAGIPIRFAKLTDAEEKALKSFAFLSQKPQLVVLNIKEGGKNIEAEFQQKIGADNKVVSICCQIESEIAELSPTDRADFLKSMGIETPAFEKIIRTSFLLLGKMYYFTVGDDEVRAWIVNKDAKAPQAAAAIHKDFERGFIKAEVVSYDDFMNFGKSLKDVKAAGKFRLEGKEYVVQDGDIISFRFNV